MPTKLDNLPEPSTRPRRKRERDTYEETIDSEKENVTEESTLPPKKHKQTRTKSTATSTSKPSTKPAAKASPKIANANKEAKKLYDETLKAIDKAIAALDKKAKDPTNIGVMFNTDDYASEVNLHLATVDKLVQMDPNLAFNLLLSMADASHADLGAAMKMCGYGDSEPEFQRLDETLLPLIESRTKPSNCSDSLPTVPHRWTRADADVGIFKTGWPNKQQRNQMYSQKMEWEKERREARRKRREEADDWVHVALSDLKEERDYLDKYGIEKYLPLSIAKLESIPAARDA